MAMRSTTLLSSDMFEPGRSDYEDRTAVYGGLVGEMLGELEARLNAPSATPQMVEEPADFLHYISVACGYLSLIMGLGLVALWISHAFIRS